MMNFDAPSPMYHPLQSDDDASIEEVMAVRTRASLAWGALQGRLTHVTPEVAHHFCCSLVRLTLVDALAQIGFPGADIWFSSWFSGLEPVPGSTVHAAAPASLVAGTLLSELSLSHRGPLADAAVQIRAAARFDTGDRHDAPSPAPSSAVEEAAKLAELLIFDPNEDWPLEALDQLHTEATRSPHFASAEREPQRLDLAPGPVAIEQRTRAMPLWALDLVAVPAIARRHPGTRPLPFPGAVRAEALRSELWPRERAILVADAASKAVLRLSDLFDTAYSSVQTMKVAVSGLRSTSRAPSLYRILSGFGPLRPIQIERALGVSKNGVRDLVAALVKAGLAEMTTQRHQAVVRATPPRHAPDHASASPCGTEAIPDTAIAEFDTAMADIDRLLARSNASISEE